MMNPTTQTVRRIVGTGVPAAALAAALVLCALESHAHAGGVVDVAVKNRAVVSGTLEPASELESFTMELPADALVTMVARGIRTSVDVSVTGPNDTPVVFAGTTQTRTGVRAIRAPVETGGLYTFDVRVRGATKPGNYSLRIKFTLPRATSLAGTVEAEAPPTAFLAEAGTLATLDLRSRVRGETVRLERIEGPNGFTLDIPAPPREPAARHVARRVLLPHTGEYRLHTSVSTGGTRVSGRVALRAPRSPGRLDVRETLRRGNGIGESRILSRRIAATGGCVDVPRLDTDQFVGIDMTATRVDIPDQAIDLPSGSSTEFTVKSDDDIVQTQGLEPAGVAVTLDAEGADFEKDVMVTLPFDVGAFPQGTDEVGVLKKEDDGSFSTVMLTSDQIDEEAGTVTFPTRRFSTFQVFRPALELAVVDEPEFPTDLTADENGALYVSGFIENDFGELVSVINRLPPGGDKLELFAGGGSETGDGVHRLDFAFDFDLGQDFVFINGLHAVEGGFLVVLTGSVFFDAATVYVIAPDGEVIRLAGNGTDLYVDGAFGPDTGLPYSCGIGEAADGDIIFVTDAFNPPESDLLIRIELDDFTVHTIAGGGDIDVSGFDPLDTFLFDPRSVVSDSQGRILVGDVDWLIRFDLENRTTETIAGTNFGEFTGGRLPDRAARRRIGGLGAPLRTVRTGILDDLAFDPNTEDVLYAADPESGLVWRFDLARDRAYIAAGRRLAVSRSFSTQRLPSRDKPVPATSEIRLPVAVQPIGDELFITELFISRLSVVRPVDD